MCSRASGCCAASGFHLHPFKYLAFVQYSTLISGRDFSPNSLLWGVRNASKNGRLGAGWSGRVPGRLVSHFLSFVFHFFSFVSKAGCLWSGFRLACHSFVSHFFSFVSHFLSFVSHFFSFASQFFSFVCNHEMVQGNENGTEVAGYLEPVFF